MATLTVYPLDRGPAYVAWRDGVPVLPADKLAHANQLISDGALVGLTPEGPHYPASWLTQPAAAALLRDVCHPCGVVGDPPLLHLLARGDAV